MTDPINGPELDEEPDVSDPAEQGDGEAAPDDLPDDVRSGTDPDAYNPKEA